MKKKLLLILSISLVFCLSSCSTSQQNILFTPSLTGQMIFIRPAKLNCTESGSDVSAVIVDITVPTSSGEITGEPAVNYSLIVRDSKSINYNSIELGFTCGTNSFTCTENTLMFKDVYKGSQTLLRFSSKLSVEDFKLLIENYSEAEVFSTIGESVYTFETDNLVAKLSEVSFYLK